MLQISLRRDRDIQYPRRQRISGRAAGHRRSGILARRESLENQNFSPESLHGSTLRVILTVDDPDTVFNKAVAAGATIVWPVADQPYRWRMGRIADPFGHHWEIGKPLTT
ncbi:MAG: VOC family protein [Silvibacterium sp.]